MDFAFVQDNGCLMHEAIHLHKPISKGLYAMRLLQRSPCNIVDTGQHEIWVQCHVATKIVPMPIIRQRG